jgi:hypothetical protein
MRSMSSTILIVLYASLRFGQNAMLVTVPLPVPRRADRIERGVFWLTTQLL